MSDFPSIRSFNARCWLSADQPVGQESTGKAALRRRLRQERENYKKTAAASNQAWGQEHIRTLQDFFRASVQDPKITQDLWPSAWTAYVPIGSELDLLGHCPMENCWLPHALPNGSLEWFRWCTDISCWTRDMRGLPQPPPEVHRQLIAPSQNQPWMIITPCLAVDRTGVRLGYGGGYYDRFLSACYEHALSVACIPAAFVFEANHLPRESHDFPVDLIVTEQDVFILNDEKLKRILPQLLNNDRG